MKGRRRNLEWYCLNVLVHWDPTMPVIDAHSAIKDFVDVQSDAVIDQYDCLEVKYAGDHLTYILNSEKDNET